jgi:hypothetical protein
MQDPLLKIRSPRYQVFQQVTIGKVLDNKNFFQTGRVRVLYESIGNHLEVEADVMQMWFGQESYRVWVPQPGDRVLIGLIDSALHFPIVIGVVPPIKEPHPWENENLKPEDTREVFKAEDRTFFIYQKKNDQFQFRILNEDSGFEIKTIPSDKMISIHMEDMEMQFDGKEKKLRIEAENVEMIGRKLNMKFEELKLEGNQKMEMKSKSFMGRFEKYLIKSMKIIFKTGR